MASERLLTIVGQYDIYVKQNGINDAIIDAYVKACHVAYEDERDKKLGLVMIQKAEQMILEYVNIHTKGMTFKQLEIYSIENKKPYKIIDYYYELKKIRARDDFESFMFFMERKRHPNKRFYEPRMCTQSIVAHDLQDLEDGKYQFYGLSEPSRVGKSTICIFFLDWVALRKPNSHSAMGGHSGVLAKGFYKELINFMTTEEYSFYELYEYFNPEYKKHKFPTAQSADDFTITLGDPDRFATITCRGCDGTWTGAIDVSKDGYLYVDDLVRDREHSLSPIRMENTFQEYLNKMVDRKNDGAKELMVGTLWSVDDPLSKLMAKYEGKDGFMFRRIPALDENDESNFQYEINGFSSEYYRNMRDKLDKAEWMAKFQQRPFVREGLLFPVEELRYSDNGNILEEESFVGIAAVDPAFGGGDSLSMPICKYSKALGKKYIVDWVFSKGGQNTTVPKIVEKIIEHDVMKVRFEKNSGGGILADEVRKELVKRGYYHCDVFAEAASNKVPKRDKINAYADFVKREFIFLLPNHEIPKDGLVERYRRTDEYTAAMNELTLHTSEGRNAHDDAADSITQLAQMFEDFARPKSKILHGMI